MQHSFSLSISDSSRVGEARRTATALASSLGYDETQRGKVALVVTEITNNILNHASTGELLLRELESCGVAGIEILAIDQGPGMASVTQCMRDGYSTAGTAGNGLGAIARLSSLLQIYSLPRGGTVLLSQLWSRPTFPPSLPVLPMPMDFGAVNRPKPGQEVCGDSWAADCYSDRMQFLLADGLGHGPEAADASREAVRAFHKYSARRPKEIMEALHGALHGTRGAAAAVVEVDLAKQEVCFAGIGNIAGALVMPDHVQNMISHNGIVGHRMHKVQEFFYPWAADALLVLNSDGLGTRWRLDNYPGLTLRHPGLIAGVLYRDFQRESDDATVLVAAPVQRGSGAP